MRSSRTSSGAAHFWPTVEEGAITVVTRSKATHCCGRRQSGLIRWTPVGGKLDHDHRLESITRNSTVTCGQSGRRHVAATRAFSGVVTAI